MGRWVLVVMLLGYALALCWRQVLPTPDPVPPTVETPSSQSPSQASTIPARMAAAWPESAITLTPDLRTIDARGEHHALVGGALVDGDQVVHACLFHTADGGRSWLPLGPAHPGARILAVHQDAGTLWAVGHEDERGGGRLFTLRSRDHGRSWQRFTLDTDPYPGARMHAGDLLFLDPEHGVLSARFDARDGERALFVTRDGGRSWRFSRARSGGEPAPDRSHVASADGWSWRLRDGIVERRGPDDSWWIPTRSQPMGAGPAGDLPYTAAR